MALSLIIQRRLTPQMGGLVCSGIPGRFALEWVADLKRNQWPIWCGIATNPPMIAIGIGNSHLTWKGIIENGEFSVNFPTAKDLLKTDYIGIISGAKEDKSHLYSARYENLKKAPLIEECPLSLECKLIQKMDFPTNTLFVGEIIGAYADKDYMDKNNFNYEKAGAYFLTMMDNTYWSFGKKIGNAWKDGKSFIF